MDVTDQVRKEIIQKATQYIRDEKDEFFNKEVADALDEGAFEQLYERFYSELAFGTAGMRGILGGGTNRINSFMVRKVTQGFANYLHKHTKHPSVAIAYDTRNYSSEFALQTALTLCANNIRVMLFDTVRPVPVLSFSVRHLKSTAGVVITASHNPSAYNGYKVYWSDGGQVTPPHDVGIAKEVERITSDMILHIDEQEAIEKGLLTYMPPEVEQSYYDSVIESLTHEEVLKNSSIHVAYTPLHGSGLEPITHLYDRLGISYDIVEEQRQYDGNFPTVSMPNPEDPEAMRLVVELAKQHKSDVVLGTDPDADRLGVALPTDESKETYQLLNGNQIAVLLVDYLMSVKAPLNKKQPVVAKSIVTSDLVKEIVERQNGKCIDVLTGFKYIAIEMNKIEHSDTQFFLFGCEESFGYLSLENLRDKDAVSSAILATEMVAYYTQQNLNVLQRLEQIYQSYGRYTEKVFSYGYEGPSGQQKMGEIMARFRAMRVGDSFAKEKITKVIDLLGGDVDGLPSSDVVMLYFENGEKLVIRPSGTEPKIKYYIYFHAEGLSKEEFEQLVQQRLVQYKEEL